MQLIRFKVLIVIFISLLLVLHQFCTYYISGYSDSSIHAGPGGSQAFENLPITNLSQYVKISDGKNLYFCEATFDENNLLLMSHLCFQFVSHQAAGYNPKEIPFPTNKIYYNGILISIICSIILFAVVALIFGRRCRKDLLLQITRPGCSQLLGSRLVDGESIVIGSLDRRSINHIAEVLTPISLPPFMYLFQDVPEIMKISWGKRLGFGTYGRVYKGKVTRPGREHQGMYTQFVAIKQLTQECRTTEQFKKIFQEVEIMSKLNSEFVVNLYGFSPSIHPCIIMEYVSGGCLDNYFKRPNETVCFYFKLQQTSLLQKLNILIQIAKGLQYLHSQGIIHHDLKPQNILIDLSDGPKIKISDFGLSKIIEDSKSASHGDAGTVRYFAPEQFDARVAKSSDIWAFACIMQECLVGEQPWKDKTYAEIVRLVTFDKSSPELPELRQKCLNADLYQLILKCLNFEKKKRPIASQIVAELERIKGIIQNQKIKTD